MAAKLLQLQVKLAGGHGQPSKKEIAAFLVSLQNDLKLTPVEAGLNEQAELLVRLSAPFPDPHYLSAEIEKLDGVQGVSLAMTAKGIDVHRPGEEFAAVLKGLKDLDKAVALDILVHATPEALYEHLDSELGYDVLHLVCHGNPLGTILLEDGKGWVRYMGQRELADLVRDKVKVFVNGACHGENSLAGLRAEENRPTSMVFVQGAYPIPSRAIHLFAETFYRNLVQGLPSDQAIAKGVDKIRRDDLIGEVANPDGMTENEAPSPFKRIDTDEIESIAFPSIGIGQVEAQDLLPAPPPHRKIIRADELLVGRETAVVSVIDELLPPRSGISESKHRLIHLHGEGGIGKTRLAQTVCDTLESYRHFSGGIFEVDCETEPDTPHLAMAILKAINVEQVEAIKDPILALPQVLKQLSQRGDVLLMLDNLDPLFAEASDHLNPHPSALLKTVLSECPTVRILSTCRTLLGLGGYEWGFMVDPLDSDVAVNLLLLCIPDRDVQQQVTALSDADKRSLTRLVGMLAGHPLSIFLAAQRLVASPDPIDKQLREAGERIPQLLEVQRLRGVPERQRSIRASLDLSYNHLSDPAKDLFRKASLFPAGLYRHVSTLDDLLGAGWRDTIEQAADIGLVRYERDEQRYWMLNPIREYAEALLDEEDGAFRQSVARHWAQFTLTQDFMLNPVQYRENYAQLDLPSDPEEKRQKLAQLHDNAYGALQAEEANILHAFQWAIKGDFASAEAIASKLIEYLKIEDKRQTSAWLALTTSEASSDPKLKAKWIGTLGNQLSELGDRQAALAHTQEALELYRALAEKHPEAFLPDVATALNNLGNQLSELGDRQAALEHTQEALQIRRALAEKHPEAFLPDVATALNNLGNQLSELGDRQAALEHTQEALQIRRALAEKHPEAFLPDVAMTLNNLGNRLSELGDRQAALEHTQEALQIRRALAEKHPEAFLPDVAMTLNNLGNRLSELGDRQAALEHTQEALQIRRALAEKHPEAFLPYVATTLNNLGNQLSEVGDRQAALEHTQEALQIRRALAEKHPEAFLPYVATTLNNLGTMLSELGDRQAALEHFQELVAVNHRYSEISHNPAHHVQALRELAEFQADIDNPEKAIASLDEAVGILTPLAENHRDALQDLIAVNERRLSLLQAQKNPRSEALESELEVQKKALAATAAPEAA